jgi:hypothetical protein
MTAHRTVHYVPVIHEAADLGAMQDTVRARTEAASGAGSWRDKQTRVAALWDEIEAWAGALDCSCGVWRVYQDGLPVCGHEQRIVNDLAAQGSRNHRLVKRLVERGAVLMGTESPELLLREYEGIKRAAESGREPDAEQARILLDERDAFIAQRILDTLEPGATGVLFIGLLHAVHDHLPDDVIVIDTFNVLKDEHDGPDEATGPRRAAS